jgi:hypothetical protein
MFIAYENVLYLIVRTYVHTPPQHPKTPVAQPLLGSQSHFFAQFVSKNQRPLAPIINLKKNK